MLSFIYKKNGDKNMSFFTICLQETVTMANSGRHFGVRYLGVGMAMSPLF